MDSNGPAALISAQAALTASKAKSKASILAVELPKAKPVQDTPWRIQLAGGVSDPSVKELPLAMMVGAGVSRVSGERYRKVAGLHVGADIAKPKSDKWAVLPRLDLGLGGGISLGSVDVLLSATTGARVGSRREKMKTRPFLKRDHCGRLVVDYKPMSLNAGMQPCNITYHRFLEMEKNRMNGLGLNLVSV